MVKVDSSAKYSELRIGDRGEEVKTLQQKLNEYNHADLVEDGIFGSKTKNAVMDFEQRIGITPDGIADSSVWLAFQSLQPTEPNVKPGQKTLWIPFARRLPEISTQWLYDQGYPRGAVVHFTAGRDDPLGTVQYLAEHGFPCLVMGRDGTIYQPFPLNRGGCHSGTNHHDYSVGIEIISAGRCTPVRINGQQKYAPWFALDNNGNVARSELCFSESEIRHVERNGSCREGYYQKYTLAQEKSLIKLLLWLKNQAPDVFSFDDVKGHDECCDEGGRPGAKNDPGGALSMTMPELRTFLKHEYRGLSTPYMVIVDDDNPPLNIRSGPGTSYSIVGTLENGTPLTVIENNFQGWLRLNSPISGWVAEYLTKV